MNMPSHFITIGGAPEGFDARLLVREIEKTGQPLIHVARDDKRLEAMRTALTFFAPDLAVFSFPAWDCLPYDRVSPQADILATRMATLAALARGITGPFILLTTLNAITQYIPARTIVTQATFPLTCHHRIVEHKLHQFLAQMGFSRSSTVMEPGDFAIRGGIVDIFPPGKQGAIRLDFFGDEIESIRRFDPETQRSILNLEHVTLSPVSEIILDKDSIARFRQNYRAAFGASGQDDPLYEAISAGRLYQGMEHWLPFFHETLETLPDYLPHASLVLDYQIPDAYLMRWEGIKDQFQSRKEMLDAPQRAGAAVYKPCPAESLYLSPQKWQNLCDGRRVLSLSPLPQGSGPGVLDAGGRIGRNFSAERQHENLSLFSALTDHIRQKLKTTPVILASYSEGSRERLEGLLQDEGLVATKNIAHFREVDLQKPAVYLAVWAVETGFEQSDLVLISEQDILGERLVRSARKRKRAENFLRETQSLSIGDLIVHVEHGIGRYLGLETVTAAGAPHECLALEYAGGDKLFLPVENIELLSRFGHEDGLLDKLGGSAWQARKAKLKERIRQIADKLIRVAAERALRQAPIIEPMQGIWDDFSARFPYQETEDQCSAIENVLEDLGRGIPMDRLICGDVGFGKTEVAMRAAFVAAMAGMQVAIITPTTLLARQHYKSFIERFRGFPIVIRQLSRFISTKEAAQTRKDLTSGTVDIVIGTHALLAKSVKFRDLGLLIVDEEQHFGVAHKERLKQMRSDIHVLTLTATPIPRTLQLGLSGVRDLSIIATPPVDRLAIRTYVSPFDPVTIREALLREHYRGGQSFYVVPRVSDIEEIETFIKESIPEIRVMSAHGQMPPSTLDERMNAFYDGQFDVLLATTIVESGLDIPSANTMIIHRADMFGLAQLYQIRGRVGRSKLRAYCFLTTNPGKPLTPQAEKRLRVLGSLDTLGSGFNLAAQDLDIRGAGNLLGEEQSGQIRDVGYELYQSMLEETIAKIKSGTIDGLIEEEGQWTPQINLGVPVLIPETYVTDLDIRLGLYRRLSTLETKVEMEGFAAELIDRFGPLPIEISILMRVIQIKALCKRGGISRIDTGPKGATIQFHQDKFSNPAGLVSFIKAQEGHAKIKDNKLILLRDWTNATQRVKGVLLIARELAGYAQKSNI